MKKVIILFITIFCITQVYGQDPTPLSHPLVNQYGGIPMNFSTGAPSVSVPVWEVKSGSLSFPVSIFNSKNCTRQGELPSEVGYGWNINAYGTISREIRDQDDFDTYGNNGVLYWGGFRESGADVISQIDYRSVDNNLDGEPDIFFLNLPGISLKFLYNNEGEIYTLSQSNVDIRFYDEYTDEEGTYENIFLVKGPNGVKYLFKQISLTYYEYFPTNDCDVEEISEIYTTWHLTKMTSHDNVDYIRFNYDERNNVELTKGKHNSGFNMHLTFNPDIYDPLPDPIYINVFSKYEQLTNKVLISTIETKREEINFNFIQSNAAYSTCYPNYNKNYFINKIIVYDKQNNKIKELALDYTESHLKEIQEINPNNETDKLPPYRFNYVSDGMLGEIHYPTGGYTKFEYEKNTYLFPTTGPWYDEDWNTYLDENKPGVDKNNIAGKGYRVKRITKYNSVDSLITEFSYLNDDGSSSGRMLNYPIYGYNFTYAFCFGAPNFADMAFDYDVNFEKGYILYNKINVFEGGKIDVPNAPDKGVNGKIDYEYSVHPPVETNPGGTHPYPYTFKIIPHVKNGILLKKNVYDNNNEPKSKTEYFYDFEETSVSTEAIKVLNKTCILNGNQDQSQYLYSGYTYNQTNVKLLSTKNETYSSPYDKITVTTTYVYEDGLLQPKEIHKTKSNGKLVKTILYYPGDDEFDGVQVYEEMRARHIISPVIKKETFIGTETTPISGIKTNYTQINNLIVPLSREIWEKDQYITATWFDEYTDDGKLLESHGIDNIHSSIIYDSNYLPIAMIVNAKESEVFHNDFEELETDYSTNSYTGKYSEHISSDNQFAGVHDFNMNELVSDRYTYSAWFNTNIEGVKLVLKEWDKSPWQSYTVPNTNGNWEYHQFTVDITDFTADELRCEVWAAGHEALVDNVRFLPADAYMSTLTYKPLVGKTSETDANGNSIYYEYDDFGRPIKVFDQDKNLVKENEYNISPLNTDDVSISGNTNTLLSGCNRELTAYTRTPPVDGFPTQFQWFSDYCGGTVIGTGAAITVNPEVKYFNVKKYFARTMRNGRCSECESIQFYVEPGTVSFSPVPQGQTFQPSGGEYTVNFEYNACDDYETEVVFPSGNTLNLQENIDYQNNTVSITCPATNESETVTMLVKFQNKNTGAGETEQFNVKRLGKLIVGYEDDYNSSDPSPGVTITLTPAGGTGSYSYGWKLDPDDDYESGSNTYFIFIGWGNTKTIYYKVVSGEQTVTGKTTIEVSHT